MRDVPRHPGSSPSTPHRSRPAHSPERGLGSAPRAVAAIAVLGLAISGLAGCSNLKFTRDTQTSGTFRSSAFTFTIISIDLPRAAIDAARENVTDARQPNVVMTEATVWPYLGPADWLLDFIGFRYAVVEGTWGFHQE